MASASSTTRVDGKTAVVTGGNGGIGFETARGLLELGAEVVIACRNPEKAQAAAETLRAETGGDVEIAVCDLGDLESVRGAVKDIAQRFGPLDILVANAGVLPGQYSETKQGYEMAYGVNVLGHTALIQGLLDAGGLATGSRVVIVTGDIYFRVEDCSPDSRYTRNAGAQRAYCSSKLGNLWMRVGFEAAHPEIEWFAVHPGVVASELMDAEVSGFRALMRGYLMLTTAEGARTSLRCATDPTLEPGYHHSAMGSMTLPEGDPAGDRERALRFLDETLALVA